jgi:hypothetical protein
MMFKYMKIKITCGFLDEYGTVERSVANGNT